MSPRMKFYECYVRSDLSDGRYPNQVQQRASETSLPHPPTVGNVILSTATDYTPEARFRDAHANHRRLKFEPLKLYT